MDFRRRHVLRLSAAAIAAPSLMVHAATDSYPARPVRLIVTTGPGGQGDTIARLIAQKLTAQLGQSFYVENIGGAGGNIAHGTAARSAPDGYTLIAAGGSLVINPSLYPQIPYDPHKDFAPISLVCSSPHVLAVHPSVPAQTVNELAALARAAPGKFSYASAGAGTPAHLAGELFKLALALDIAHVPFKGGGPGIGAVVAGHVPIAISALPTALPYVKAGNVRALALISSQRSSVLPEAPTMAEAGTPLAADIVTGLLTRAGTPQPIVDLLHQAVVRALAEVEFRQRLVALGFEPVGSTPDEFMRWIELETAKWAKVVRAAKIAIQ
jgi:tripartite-type tricarboxylate transporter receptor subunit TctC